MRTETDDDTFLPDLIKGDLDSLKPQVAEYYRAKVRRRAVLLPHMDGALIADDLRRVCPSCATQIRTAPTWASA